MTISSTTSKVSFNGSGSTGPFSIPYKFSKNADLAVTKASTAGVESTLALTTNYTLAGAGAPSGGTLTLLVALAAGERLIIKRSPEKVQDTDYVENASFPAKAHEDALDLLTMVSQDLQEQIDRSVKVGIGSTTDPDALIATLEASAPAAAASASAAATSASAAAVSAAVALAASGGVKVSANDTTHGDLETKLLAGTGLVLSTQNDGASETRTVAVDVGTSAGKIPVLDAGGKLVSSIIPSSIGGVDQAARDNSAMNAFVAHIQAGRATGPVPGGGIWLFATDEMTKTGAAYNSTAKAYGNTVTLGPDIVPTLAGPTSGTFTVSQTSIYGGSLYPGWKAFDGSTVANNSWISASTFPQTLTVDFGGVSYTIGGVTLRCDDEIARAPRDFTIQTYDGASWITRYTATGVTWTANETKTLSLTPVSCKGLRIVVTAANGAPETEINEMELLPLLSTAAMTLTTPVGIALGYVPTKVTLYLLHKSVEALTYNTDLIAKASRGTDYATASDLAALCQYDTDYKILRATVDLSALASGSTGLWRVETTDKSQQVRAALALYE